MGGAAASLLAQGLRRIRAERKALSRLQRQARPESPPAEKHIGFESRFPDQSNLTNPKPLAA
jgi:hypothetical protein